jgi:hypothetical protein
MKIKCKVLILSTIPLISWACSTYVKVVEFTPCKFPQTKETEVEMFLTGPPAGREYIEIGTLEVYTLDYRALKERAARIGAHAIIQGGSKTAGMVPVAGILYAANTTTFVAVRWKDN